MRTLRHKRLGIDPPRGYSILEVEDEEGWQVVKFTSDRSYSPLSPFYPTREDALAALERIKEENALKWANVDRLSRAQIAVILICTLFGGIGGWQGALGGFGVGMILAALIYGADHYVHSRN